MGNNSFNINGIDFSQLPEDFKIELNLSGISFQTGNALNNIKDVDINDGIDKTEAELILMAINTDDNADEIDMDEIRKFCSENNIMKDGEPATDAIEKLVETIVTKAKENMPKTEGEEDDDEVDPKDNEIPQTDGKTGDNENDLTDITINIQRWGSPAEDDNKYANDCLDHIMKNYYPDLTPYSKEWQDKELEIMNANQEIYGNENGEGGRTRLHNNSRHNAVLYTDDELILPGIKSAKPAAADEKPTEDEGGGADGTTTGSKQIPDDAGISETKDLGDGYNLKTYVKDGKEIGKRQFNGEEIMWESTTAKGEDGTTIETKSWMQDGRIESITYDKDGKEIAKNTVFADSTSKTTYSYDNDGNKTAEVKYSDTEGNEFATATIVYNEDGSYIENKEYIAGENKGKKVETQYNKFEIKQQDIITDKENNTVATTLYENGKPKTTEVKDTEGNPISNIEYTYNEDGTYNVATTYKNAAEANDKLESNIQYAKDGTPVNEDYKLKGDTDTGVITGNITYKNGLPSTRNEVYENTGKKIEITYAEDGKTEAARKETEVNTNSQPTKETEFENKVKVKEINRIYDTLTGELIEETSIEYYEDGKAKNIKATQYDPSRNVAIDSCTIIYNKEGGITSKEGNTKLLPTEFQSETAPIEDSQPDDETRPGEVPAAEITEDEIKTAAGELALTQLSEADKARLEAEGEITIGDYTLQKTDDGGIRTLKLVATDDGTYIGKKLTIVKEEWPDRNEVKLYEIRNDKRELKKHLRQDGQIASYLYVDGYQDFVYDPDTKTVKESDTAKTRKIETVEDSNGNQISYKEYIYDENNREIEVARNMNSSRLETKKIEAYKEALQDANLSQAQKYNLITTILDDETLSCNDFTKLLETLNEGNNKTDIMNIVTAASSNGQEFFNKLTEMIKRTNLDEVGPFLETWQTYSSNKSSLMNSIQDRQSFGTETATLKALISALQDKIQVAYDTDTMKAKAFDLGISQGSWNTIKMNEIMKLYNSDGTDKIDAKTAYAFLLLMGNGDMQNIIQGIRNAGTNEKEYVKFIEDVLIAASKE